MRADHIKPKVQPYVLPGYIPRGTVTLVVGKRSAGKSLFTTWLVEALTTGQVPGPDGNIVEQRPLSVWVNSREDPVESILIGRVHATGADRKRVFLSDHHWLLPSSLGDIREELLRVRETGFDPAVLILDSMQQHVYNAYHGHVRNRQAMVGINNFARDHDVSVIFVHHFIKGKTATVEAAIGGQGIIQNLSKTIYILGHYPTQESDLRVLACERNGYGRKPPSLLFDLNTRPIRGLGSQPYLYYQGPVDASAMDVFRISKKDEGGSGEAGYMVAATFIREYIVKAGRVGQPVKIADIEREAQVKGVYFSKGTFDRARKVAGLRPVRRTELEKLFGDEWFYLSEADQHSGWVVLEHGDEVGDTDSPPARDGSDGPQ
jgi:KaiC/GvpD/RAD55 family RecA-like ATPase